MAIDQALLSHDLRGPSVDYKRDRIHAAKWVNGEKNTIWYDEQPYKTRYSVGLAADTRHPIQMRHAYTFSKARDARLTWAQRGRQHRQRSRRAGRRVVNGLEGTYDEYISASSEDDVWPTPCPDEGITYSYDAATGPTSGSHVLAAALTNAVHKFEVKQTDKLIKDEYEVIQPESPFIKPFRGIDDTHSVDDDFELI